MFRPTIPSTPCGVCGTPFQDHENPDHDYISDRDLEAQVDQGYQEYIDQELRVTE